MAITSTLTRQAAPLVRFREGMRQRRRYLDIRDQLLLVRAMAAGDVSFYVEIDRFLGAAEERIDFFDEVTRLAAKELGSARPIRLPGRTAG